MERIGHQNTPAVNPRRTRFNAGSAKNSSGASFAQKLRAWWATQSRFGKQQDFASALNVAIETIQQWMQGRAFPSDPLCEKLYEVTQLECFSPNGRTAARAEHEQKRGLSHAAIAKREKRQYLTTEELAQCQADPEKAFTIRGDEWIACVECGQLLKQIRFRGAAAHNCCGKSEEQYREGRYGKNRPLICNALAAKKRADLAARANLRPDAGLANLRPPKKGRKMPPEFSRKQSARMRGQRNAAWAKDAADVDFVWPWLMERKGVEAVAKERGFSQGGAWARINAIIGAPVRRNVTRDDLASAAPAMEIVHRCGGDDAKLKSEVSRLCSESREQLVHRTARVARTVMFWIPRALDWWQRNPSRAQAMSGSDLGRVFAAGELPKLKSAKRTKKSDGRPKGMTAERIEEAENLLAQIRQLGGKRGAIKIASAQQYPNLDTATACDRGRKTLQEYREYRKTTPVG